MIPMRFLLPALLLLSQPACFTACSFDSDFFLDDGPFCECFADQDCGRGFRCLDQGGGCGFCDVATNGCFSDADCTDGTICDVARGQCERPLVCDAANPSVTCADGQQCLVTDEGGLCRTPPSATLCQIWPPTATHPAGTVELDVIAYATDGSLVPAGTATLTAGDVVISPTVEGHGFLLDTSCAGPERCTIIATALVGEARCEARVRVLPALLANDARIVVHDRELGRPISGAKITAVIGGSIVNGATDTDGVFSIPGAAIGGADFDRVSVFANGFEGDTCFSCARDHHLALRRITPAAQTPAVGGDMFTGEREPADFSMGLAGLALVDPDFGTRELFGVPGFLSLQEFGLDPVQFSSGGTMSIGFQPARSRFAAFGRPGARSLWAFRARLALTSIAPIVDPDTPRDARLEFLRISSTVTQSAFAATTTPVPFPVPANRNTDLNQMIVPGNVTLVPDVGVAAEVNVTLPTSLPAGASDLLIAIGAVIPGDGTALLGGSVVATTPLPQNTVVHFAPPHDGLEGRALVLIAIAVNEADLKDRDLLGAHRVVVPMAPAPNRTLEVVLPPFAQAPGLLINGTSIAINEASDVDFITATLDVVGEGQHRVRIKDQAGKRADLAMVADDANFAGVNLNLAAPRIGSTTTPSDLLRPWRGVHRIQVSER